MSNKFDKLSQNTRFVVINAVNGFGIKGLGIIIGLLTTPAYMQYFYNQAVLGVWFTLLSVLSWVLNFDLGIGNGLRNRLVVTFIEKDEVGSKKYISSAYIFLSIIATMLGFVIVVVINIVSWNKLFGIAEIDVNPLILNRAVIIVFASIIIQFVLRIISSILYALQKAFIPNLLSLITNILLLIYVTVCNHTGDNNDIVGLAIIYFVAVNLPLLVTTLILFLTKLRKIRPNFRYFEMRYAIDTLKIGGAFLGLQIEAMIINNTSIFLITWLLGSIYVVEYNVYFKVFSLSYTMFSIITASVWSAITKANGEKKYKWIKKTNRTLQFVGLLFILVSLCMMPFMQFVFNIWLGKNSFLVNYRVMCIFVVEQGIIIWSSINASICNGLNEFKMQFKLMTFGAIIIVPVAILLANIIEGYYAVIIAHIIALLPYCIGQSIWIEQFTKKKSTNQ